MIYDFYFKTTKDEENQTPCHLACKLGHVNVVKILFELVKDKIDLELKNCYGETVLEVAEENGNMEDILELLGGSSKEFSIFD